jgi:hypothetical protein
MLNALGHANGCSAPKRLRSASAANTVGPGAKEEDEPETEQSPQSVADNAVTHIPKLLWERLPELGILLEASVGAIGTKVNCARSGISSPHN